MAHIGTEVKDKVVPHTAGRTPVNAYIPPSDGVVKHGDQVVIGANPHVAMVFQSFALLPWATVQENVELGLKARGVPQAARAA
jgi:ABC-type taurine transport system ATPase subunit